MTFLPGQHVLIQDDAGRFHPAVILHQRTHMPELYAARITGGPHKGLELSAHTSDIEEEGQ